MKKAIKILIVLNLLMITFMLIMAYKAYSEYVTSEDGLRVRKHPVNGEIIEVLPFGSEVFGEIENGWMRTEDGKYLCADYLSVNNPIDAMEYQGEWRVTAYAYTGSPCANGKYPTAGFTIAHNSLPFGTKVYIDGVGFRTVEDRGQTWLGEEWCDLYLGDYGSCVQWGNQYRKVWVMTG